MTEDFPRRHGLSEFVVHELTPVLMALQMVSRPASAADARLLEAAADQLGRLLEILPGLDPQHPSPAGAEPLAEAVSSALLLSGVGSGAASLAPDAGSAQVPAPHTRLILRNLLSNAIAHAEPPTLLSARLSPAGLHVSVRDGGPSGLGSNGMGMGRSISAALAAASGMSLSFRTSPAGSVAELTLPSAV